MRGDTSTSVEGTGASGLTTSPCSDAKRDVEVFVNLPHKRQVLPRSERRWARWRKASYSRSNCAVAMPVRSRAVGKVPRL